MTVVCLLVNESEYLGAMLGALPEKLPEQYCNVGAVHALLGHFASICREEDIRFHCNISIPESKEVEPLSLCVIFGTKAESGHGLGLGSIRATVERYRGWCEATMKTGCSPCASSYDTTNLRCGPTNLRRGVTRLFFCYDAMEEFYISEGGFS